MTSTASDTTPARTYRRYQDGDHAASNLRERIFQASHSYKCPTYIQSTPPCQGSCPAGEDIRGYLSIVRGLEKPVSDAQGKTMTWQEAAWRRLTRANPFPAVMGRVCPAPCEKGCNRNEVEDHVGINSVEHFLGEYAIAHQLKFVAPKQKSGKKVAILGGGPAGLSCAYQLALRGHAVTVFDEHTHLGGMMRYGIPGFRTPRAVLDAEIQRILDLGVEARLSTHVGKDVSIDDIRRDFDAVFLGMGAQSGRPLPLSAEDNAAPNVVTATAFLQAFNDGRLTHVGRRVVVVGGGDTSIDVATVARRLGHIEHAKPTEFESAIANKAGGLMGGEVAKVSAKIGCEVTLTSVFDVSAMQANPHEIEQARAEGIDIRGGWMPIGVVRSPTEGGRATALRVARCSAKLSNGALTITRLAIQEGGAEEDIPADLIVSAIGQAVDLSGLEVFDNGRGSISADKNYQVQKQPGVFAGGDVLRPHLLTTAIGHGAIAADGIDAYLAGRELDKRPKIDVHTFDLHRQMIERGLTEGALNEPLRGTCESQAAVHNFDSRADRYVIPHDELFLGHFTYEERQQRAVVTLDKESALGNFDERLRPLTETEAVAEAGRCMSCGLCFECDNCLIYCPQGAVKRVPKKQAAPGRYVMTDYDRCIGCHICHDVCPTGYIQMGLGE